MRLLIRVATMYYEEQVTQGEIARLRGLSRPKVQRLLQEALAAGIVQIRVVPPTDTDSAAERLLESRYGLQEVVAVEVPSDHGPDAVTQALGRAAARYVTSVLRDDVAIGLSWGNTLAAMVSAMEPRPLRNARVVQILGALHERPNGDEATGLARRFALAINAPLHLVPAPGIVAEALVHDALMNDASVGQTLDLARKVDIAIVGIGSMPARSEPPSHHAVLLDSEVASLQRAGAVGDIALRFFDEAGRQVRNDFDRRVVGLDLEEIRALHVISVAGGEGKVAAIRGALRGRLTHTLITDAATARRLAGEPEK